MNKKKFIINLIVIMLTLVIIYSGIFLPSYINSLRSEEILNAVHVAPENLYSPSNTLLAKNVSEQLSTFDKLKLISGSWESNYEELSITSSEPNLTESEAAELCKDQINFLFEGNVYPYSLSSIYDNWYTRETKLYKFTDQTFNTYTTYVWLFKFTKYDNQLVHTILMCDNGTILEAQVNDNSCLNSDIGVRYNTNYINQLFHEDNLQTNGIYTSSLPKSYSYPIFDRGNITMDKVYLIKIILSNRDVVEQYVYQYHSNNCYGIGTIPK